MVRLRDSWRFSLSAFPIPENPLPTPSAGVRIRAFRTEARFSAAPRDRSRLASERVPCWFRGELEIAHVDPQPRADAGADRNHNHLVVHRRREPEASDHIG